MDPARDSRERARPPLRVRLARWLQPPRRLRPTRAGWSFFAITFGVGFAALNTGNNLLYLVLSLMLAFLVLSGVLSESALRGIQVRRHIPRELFAGASCRVGLEITNRQQRVTAYAIVVEDRFRDSSGRERPAGRAFALTIRPGATERRVYSLQPPERGSLEFTRFEVFTRFPFGLFSKSLTLASPDQAVVYPEVEIVPAPANFGAAREGGESIVGGRGDGAEATGLREFAPGDPMRHVHWRATARRGALLVREVESERQAEIEVRLRTLGVDRGEIFERSVHWAASEVASLLAAQARVSLRTDAEHFPADGGPRQRARLLSFLAFVQPAGRGADTRPSEAS